MESQASTFDEMFDSCIPSSIDLATNLDALQEVIDVHTMLDDPMPIVLSSAAMDSLISGMEGMLND